MAESSTSDVSPAETAATAEASEPSISSAKTPLTPQEISDKIMERVDKAKTYKADGNESYKQKDIKAAIGKYHRALLYVKGLDSMAQQDVVQRLIGMGGVGYNSDGPQNFGEVIAKLLPADIETTVSGIQQGCYNNLAACLLQQENPSYEKVIFYCDKVLETLPVNAKALYRKGQSLYHLHDYTKALSALKKAKQSVKSDPNVKKYISLCEARIADQEEKEKLRCKAMFEKMAEEEAEDGVQNAATAAGDATTSDAPTVTAAGDAPTVTAAEGSPTDAS